MLPTYLYYLQCVQYVLLYMKKDVTVKQDGCPEILITQKVIGFHWRWTITFLCMKGK